MENKEEVITEVKEHKFKIPKELQHKYNQSYYTSHKGEKVTCPQCKYQYSIFNKSHHLKSKLHLQVLEFLKNN